MARVRENPAFDLTRDEQGNLVQLQPAFAIVNGQLPQNILALRLSYNGYLINDFYSRRDLQDLQLREIPLLSGFQSKGRWHTMECGKVL